MDNLNKHGISDTSPLHDRVGLPEISSQDIRGGTFTIGNNIDEVLKVGKDGLSVGDKDFASAPFKVDYSGALTATSATITGAITATSGAIGGWNVLSGYIYNLQSGTPTSSPSDGIVLASGNEGITIYENTEKRVEIGYLSSGVYGIKGYDDDGSTVMFELSDSQKLISGVPITNIASGTEIAIQGWQQDMAFSASDYRTVAWASGTITLLDGTTYSITGANTGNISALTYIYLDIAASTTALQITTTAATAVGAGKILIAVAENNSDTSSNATFQVFGGKGGNNLLVDNIAANSASTNEFVSNTAQIKDAIVTNAKIDTLAVSKLTAGTITSKIITLAFTDTVGDVAIKCGKTDFGDDATSGFILGVDDSDSNKVKFEIGSAATKVLKYDGTDLTMTGGAITGGTIELTGAGPITYFSGSTTGISGFRTAGGMSSWFQAETSGPMTLAGTGDGTYATYIHLTSGKDETTASFTRNVATCSNAAFSLTTGSNENSVGGVLAEMTAAGTTTDLLKLTRSGASGYCLGLVSSSTSNTDPVINASLAHAGAGLTMGLTYASNANSIMSLSHAGTGSGVSINLSNTANTSDCLSLTRASDGVFIGINSNSINDANPVYGLKLGITNAGAGLEYAFDFDSAALERAAGTETTTKYIRVQDSGGAEYYIKIYSVS